jgi:hypothetical protein
MRKTIILLMLFLILPFTQAISLYSAQDIAKEYMLSTEFLDSSVYYINCDSNQYYVLNIVDSKGTIVLFLPIESNNGEVLYKKSTTSQNTLKTSLLYRNIKTKDSSGKNFLSQQLIDKIENLNISLQSKSAKLDGIIKSNYSVSITAKCQNTKDKLESLISKLQDLKTKLNNLQKYQTEFLETPDCSKTDDLIYAYKTSFTGYNDLIASGINYRDATNEIVEVVIADQKLDETTKKIIMNYTEAPGSLSTDISTIVDSVSSTNQFYSSVISDFDRVGPNSPLEILQETLISRQDYFIAKSLLYNFDNDLKSTLDNAINNILNSENINFWKDTKTVSELSQNYAQIKELYNKGRYTESISKIKIAKNQVKKINAAGITQLETQDISKYIIYLIIVIIVILGTIILVKQIRTKSKKKPKKTTKEIDPEYLLNRRDPFR